VNGEAQLSLTITNSSGKRRGTEVVQLCEKRLLEVIGEDVMEEIKRRDSVGPPSVLVA
jgi:hypothetical protein